MEEESYCLSMSAPTILTITIILALSISLPIITRLLARKRAGDVHQTAPEAGGSWPLLGHLPLLGGPRPGHLVLAQMADKYGPIFTLRLGIHRTVVVNTWEVAKECLTTHDRALATWPRSLGPEVLGYNYAMLGFSPYGSYWRQIRKITTLEMLSTHRIELLRHVRESEVLASVKDVYDKFRTLTTKTIGSKRSPVLLNMKRWFGDITVNVVFRMIVGKQREGDEKRRQTVTIRDFFDLMGRFVVSDAFPFLRWLDIGGYEKAMMRTAKELDRVMQRWLDEHKLRRKQREELEEVGAETNIEQDFMDVMLSILEDNEEVHSCDADTINKATCLAMILAASDTTTVTMTWALSLLLNNKDALKKAQQELDAQVGKDRQVKESDLKNLPYLQAIIKETMRLYPAAPLPAPHEAIEDCNVSGYFVPKGTRLLLNLSKIQRDPRVWPNPSEFKPEKFLTTHKDIDVRGQNFELIPFGSGRRICPGIPMALQVMGLTLSSFIHAFEITTPGDETVDMEEVIGFTNLKASPLDVLVTPRIPDHIYQ